MSARPLLSLLLLSLAAGCGDKEIIADVDRDGSFTPEDCDDADATIFPGANEYCDGIDTDCDGVVDESPTDGSAFYIDADGDGHGAGDAEAVIDCEAPSGLVSNTDDCDDADPAINPDADEYCDEVDHNCDGELLDGAVDTSTWYPDRDSDGYGTDFNSVQSCEDPGGYAEQGGDCNDGDAAAYPGGLDIWYDGQDRDCAGNSDYDQDGDGYDSWDYEGEDCNDFDPAISPDAVEVWYDGVDQNCDGFSDFDLDTDGYDGTEYGGEDCDDADTAVNPDAVEIWYDGADQDCDNRDDYDADLDGYISDAWGGDDCDDADASVRPYAWEDDSDGIDNDCDGYPDTTDPDVATSLSLSDDAASQVSPEGWAFPFCGSDRSSMHVSSNGMISFSGSYTSYTETTSRFLSAGDMIAVWWDDLYPPSGGSVNWVDYGDAIGVFYVDIREISSNTPNSFSAVMFDNGVIQLSYPDLNIQDGIIGWTCSDNGGASAVDFSDTNPYANALGLGSGTDGAFFESFSTAPDVGGNTYTLCGTAGVDADGDGYTDLCGDPDDSDASVVP